MIEVYYAEDDETIGKSVKEYLEQQNCKVAVFDRIADVKKALIGHLPRSAAFFPPPLQFPAQSSPCSS